MIVFAGNKVPNTVTYEWLEKRCYIYRKTRPVYLNCGEPGPQCRCMPKPKVMPAPLWAAPQSRGGTPMFSRMWAMQGVPSNLRKAMPTQFFRPDKPSKIADGEHKNEKNGEGRSQSRGRQKVRLRSGPCNDERPRVGDVDVDNRRHRRRGRSSLQGRFTSRRRQSAWKARKQQLQKGRSHLERPTMKPPSGQANQRNEAERPRGRLLPAVEKTSSKPQQHGQVQPNPPLSLGDIYQQIIQEFQAFREQTQAQLQRHRKNSQKWENKLQENRRYIQTAITATRREKCRRGKKTQGAKIYARRLVF
ncbi:hypothetical protein HPB48_026926 [Haemaphysalis longicornis]|uniref:Uncharacterized protein n=1 Tax=Haemaphysalis longicornis TaxID=44386 RepID=A0A9J6HDE5_HAELO|nr:hypothetical protein HPB48_026926 [Haemaphysalis longicornis]